MHPRVAGLILIVAGAAIVGAPMPDSRPFTRVLFLEHVGRNLGECRASAT